jgi:hypothetical protein
VGGGLRAVGRRCGLGGGLRTGAVGWSCGLGLWAGTLITQLCGERRRVRRRRRTPARRWRRPADQPLKRALQTAAPANPCACLPNLHCHACRHCGRSMASFPPWSPSAASCWPASRAWSRSCPASAPQLPLLLHPLVCPQRRPQLLAPPPPRLPPPAALARRRPALLLRRRRRLPPAPGAARSGQLRRRRQTQTRTGSPEHCRHSL